MATRMQPRGFPVPLPEGFDPPEFETARLPESYASAVMRLQGILDAANKGEIFPDYPVAALAVYARMAEDASLVTLASRIRELSRQRCIELLRLIEAQKEQPVIRDLFPQEGRKRRARP